MPLRKDSFQRPNACDNCPVIVRQSYRRSMLLKRIEKTRSEPFTSDSKPDSDAPLWLQEQVYMPKRQRTIDLVKRSVNAQLKDKQRVSLSTVAAKSREFDEKGISESAILDNQETRASYEQHRTWHGNRKRRAKALTGASPAKVGPVKPDRDEQRARQRYLRMSKEEL